MALFPSKHWKWLRDIWEAKIDVPVHACAPRTHGGCHENYRLSLARTAQLLSETLSQKVNSLVAENQEMEGKRMRLKIT